MIKKRTLFALIGTGIAGITGLAYVNFTARPATVAYSNDPKISTQQQNYSDYFLTGPEIPLFTEFLAPATAPTATPVTSPTKAPVTAPTSSSSDLPRGTKLYLAPNNRPAKMADKPIATWLGEWSGDVQAVANDLTTKAAASGSVPVMVAYNIPYRDCGSYSAGGAAKGSDYRTWINKVAAGIGSREAIVIVEPDALAQISCLPESGRTERYQLLKDAVAALNANGKNHVYIDAGNPKWVSAKDMASRLTQAGVATAAGFALNVSNFYTTAENKVYGDQLTSMVNKPYVIDTGRNAKGSHNGQWCNPWGSGLGDKPTTNTTGNVDAYLWVKVPGESDGQCNGGPAAGTWWQAYADDLIRNAAW